MHKQIKFRSFKNYSKEIFQNALRNITFPNYEKFSNINLAYTDFMDKLMLIVNKLCPIKEARVKSNSQEWFDGEIAEKIIIRDKLFKKFKVSKLQIDRELYNEARNKVHNLIRKKKKIYYEEQLKNNIGKPKELWKSLKSLGSSNKKASSRNICLEDNNNNNNKSFDAKTNTEIFKTFFCELANNLVSKLPNPSNRFGIKSVISYYNNNKTDNRKIFSFNKVLPETVIDLLNNTKTSKAAGLDNLPGIFLKDGAEIISAPVTQLCNLSISHSSFPNECKTAKLIPLYKKGSKLCPKNYRPISLLPLLSKIIEKVIHDQTQKFLNENDILYRFQSGFRKNYSTDLCLSFLNDKIIKGFDKGLLTGMILIDLQKAFDTINHTIFFDKMKALGFSEQVINWFQSYLSNRTFQVAINNQFSSCGNLTCGVPQGSILGPLIFLLYVNDMNQAVDCDLFLYADDSCLVFQHKNVKDIEIQLNKNFSNLCDWFVDNKLSIHFGEDKTKSILFTPRSKINKVDKLNIAYKHINIKQYSKVTYLGCILDESLSGESMAIYVMDKINKKIKFLYRKSQFLTSPLRRLLCNALIQPHFDYACLAWFPNFVEKM